MRTNVRTLTHRTDAARFRTAAQRMRSADNAELDDLADLIDAYAQMLDTIPAEPLGEVEMWRLSFIGLPARRIVGKWVGR